MHPSRTSLDILILTFILSFALPVSAADWPQWGGRDNRNMVSSEKNLPESFEADKDKAAAGTAKNVKWIARLGAYAYGNPTIADGRVFVGTNAQTLSGDPRYDYSRGGLLKCFNEADGKLLWQLGIPERKKLAPGTHFGLQHRQ